MPAAGALLNLGPNSLVVLFLMIVRISSLLMTTPILGARTVPSMVKIALAIVLALVLLPTTASSAVLPPTFGHLVIAIGKEVVIGLLAGFAVTLVFSALQLVASLVGIQIGFGFSSTVDANFAGQSPVLDHLFTGIATLIFLSGNFHHQFLMGIQGIFNALPPNAFSIFRLTPEGLITLSANMFVSAARMVLPLVGALLLADVALGIMARTAPQMNVFFVGMPIKIAIGIIAIILVLPFVVNQIEGMFGQVTGDIALLLRF